MFTKRPPKVERLRTTALVEAIGLDQKESPENIVKTAQVFEHYLKTGKEKEK